MRGEATRLRVDAEHGPSPILRQPAHEVLRLAEVIDKFELDVVKLTRGHFFPFLASFF